MRGHGRVFKIPPNHQHHGDLDHVSRSFLTVNRLFPHISHFLTVSPLHPKDRTRMSWRARSNPAAVLTSTLFSSHAFGLRLCSTTQVWQLDVTSQQSLLRVSEISNSELGQGQGFGRCDVHVQQEGPY